MSITRIDPPIPLETACGFGYAHFLDDPGDERDCFWVVFLETGQIWWVPNPQVRACRNFSLGRIKPEVPAMAKSSKVTQSLSKMHEKGGFRPGGHKGKLHRELGVAEGKKIPKKRLEQAEHSKDPEIARDARRAEVMEHWHHSKKAKK